MNVFETNFAQLNKEKKLVLVKHCGSQWQRGFLQNLAEGRQVVDLADPLTREQATNYTGEFLQSLNKPTLLYNLQLLPELVNVIAGEQTSGVNNCLAVLEQSSAVEERLADVAQAAIVDLPLRPLDESEFEPEAAWQEPVKQANVLGSIVEGSLFGQAGASDRQQFYSQYLRSMVKERIMEQTTVSDDLKFYRFLCMAANMTGTIVNYSRLAASAGITPPTAKQWLQFLAGSGLIYLLPAVEELAGKRLIKAPKLYFRDTGVAAHLLHLESGQALLGSIYAKNLLDNYVVNAIRERFLQGCALPPMLFYKDSNYKEIQLLWAQKGVLHPLNIYKDGFSLWKVRKDFALLEGYAAERGLTIGTGAIVGLGRGTEPGPLGNALYYIAAESL